MNAFGADEDVDGFAAGHCVWVVRCGVGERGCSRLMRPKSGWRGQKAESVLVERRGRVEKIEVCNVEEKADRER